MTIVLIRYDERYKPRILVHQGCTQIQVRHGHHFENIPINRIHPFYRHLCILPGAECIPGQAYLKEEVLS